MQLKFASSAALALLIVTGATAAHADKRKKSSGDTNTEVSANENKQFEWENKVVGPKEGIDKNRLAAIQEQGRREDAERKKAPPKKAERAKGIDAAGSASLPTMDIEKAAAPTPKKQKKVAVSEPKRKDSLDNLLDSEGIKPDNPSSGKTGDDGLGSIVASDSGSKKASKKHRR
ncbi:MAG TPA: hypothetical protein VGP64_13545 [Polyangia bacterium]|jgi:hypothetical protein